jgi:predicted MFS family arabinose efflux permease
VRSATTQVGYLIGSLFGGLALAAGGHALVGVVLAALFAASAMAYVCRDREGCTGRPALAAA